MRFSEKLLTLFSGESYMDLRARNALETLRPLLINNTLFDGLINKGFAIVPFLTLEELKPLRHKMFEYCDLAGKALASGQFYTSGRDELQARAAAKTLSWPFVKDYLPRIINPGEAHMEGCAWLIKPPGDQGSLSPHQDSSLIDETQFASLYGWMPLQDVNAENGTIHVIPGSHLWGIHFRSLDVPWPLEGYTELLLQHSIPLEMKAGEMLLFEGALIHGSGMNTTNQLRVALNFFFRPKAAKMLHFMVDEQTPPGKVESFEITADFFQQHNFRERPNTALFPFHQYYDFSSLRWPEKKVKELLAGSR